MKLFLVIVFNIVAVTMVITVDDPWIKFGIIFLQLLLLGYQLINNKG